ncbi:MAG: hypothetical protein MI919_04220 [Holophagales bacterium]|nr:hypothetical protein [Holophagales bacterium]
MPTRQRIAVDNHRRRLRERGFARLEVVVPEADKPLIRALARRLRGRTEEAAATRRSLARLTGERDEVGLKELLASAPLDGIELERDRHHGREVELWDS